MQLPVTQKGNKYADVFMNYLTKWPEIFPTKDQTAPTIAKLLVEKIISRHGVPSELLSDRGPSFLSGLMEEIYSAMGIHKATQLPIIHRQMDRLSDLTRPSLTFCSRPLLLVTKIGTWNCPLYCSPIEPLLRLQLVSLPFSYCMVGTCDCQLRQHSAPCGPWAIRTWWLQVTSCWSNERSLAVSQRADYQGSGTTEGSAWSSCKASYLYVWW